MTPVPSHNEPSTEISTEALNTRQPLKPSGILDKFGYEDVTPVIGREFPNLNLVDDILKAENADELIKELAITSE